MTSRALRFYLIGLPFAGTDFLLNYTFYARQNTRAPATVGVISIGFYFVTALLLKDGPLGFLGLVLADSVKQAAHAVIMTVLLLRSVGRLNRQHVLRTIGLSTAAAGLMAAVLYLLSEAIGGIAPKSIIGAFLVVAVAGGLGGALYLAIMHWMRVEEVSRLVDGVTRRFLRRR